MKKRTSVTLLATMLFLSPLSFTACDDGSDVLTLRVGSWDEYIDEGGEDSYAVGSKPMYEEFEAWYEQVYHKKIHVEYVSIQDNETMYNKINMGDRYDLLCPSEYMIMKLAAEDKLEPYDDEFYDASGEHNYYAQNVSPYIYDGTNGVFDTGKTAQGEPWSKYAAGYMWGTTGFVINPESVAREDASRWSIFQNEKYKRKITSKDNVRDAYFTGLGTLYENELLAKKDDLAHGRVSLSEYKTYLNDVMNRTDEATMNAVREELVKTRQNLYGLETDEGKMDIITGKFDVSYQWSGDAVYVLDKAEEYGLALEYVIPEAASNLWFDGWVMLKGIDAEQKAAAQAFVNFLSLPENAVRNTAYVGYTSCISGPTTGENAVYDYIEETYGADENEKNTVEYDLSYFFGNGRVLTTAAEQTRRQLFAQYPDRETIDRLVVMQYFTAEENERANRIWITIK